MVQVRTRANARTDWGRPFPFPLADLTSLNDYEVIINSYLTGRNHLKGKLIQTTLFLGESFQGIKKNQTMMTADAGRARITQLIVTKHNNKGIKIK